MRFTSTHTREGKKYSFSPRRDFTVGPNYLMRMSTGEKKFWGYTIKFVDKQSRDCELYITDEDFDKILALHIAEKIK